MNRFDSQRHRRDESGEAAQRIPPSGAPSEILQLQRHAGNRVVAGLLGSHPVQRRLDVVQRQVVKPRADPERRVTVRFSRNRVTFQRRVARRVGRWVVYRSDSGSRVRQLIGGQVATIHEQLRGELPGDARADSVPVQIMFTLWRDPATRRVAFIVLSEDITPGEPGRLPTERRSTNGSAGDRDALRRITRIGVPEALRDRFKEEFAARLVENFVPPVKAWEAAEHFANGNYDECKKSLLDVVDSFAAILELANLTLELLGVVAEGLSLFGGFMVVPATIVAWSELAEEMDRSWARGSLRAGAGWFAKAYASTMADLVFDRPHDMAEIEDEARTRGSQQQQDFNAARVRTGHRAALDAWDGLGADRERVAAGLRSEYRDNHGALKRAVADEVRARLLSTM